RRWLCAPASTAWNCRPRARRRSRVLPWATRERVCRQRRFRRMITLRAGTRADIEAVLAFWLDATAEPSTTDDADGLTGLLERSPGALILAVDGDAIIGS